MAYAAVPAVNRGVEMWFDGPQEQRRWTVLIRFILVIPQAIVLGVLEIALAVVAVIGWFAALFIGHLPEWAHRFNSGYTRWYTRYLAYAYLLTDEYPPFEFDDLPYPARPILPPPGRLNRAAVFFRIILVFPAAVFQGIVTYGLLVPILFVVWLIMVFTGRMPVSLYWAYSSWVRFQARVMAYLLLVTPEYPWGMLGDRGSVLAPPFPPPPAPPPYAPPAPFAAPPAPVATTSPGTALAPESEGEEGAEEVVEAAPAETEPASPAENPGQAPAAFPPPTGPPAWPPPPPSWDPTAPSPPPGRTDADRKRLVLPQSARNWLVFAIVWGSILLVGYVAIISVIVSSNATSTVNEYNTSVNDYNASVNAIRAISSPQSCTSGACLTAARLLDKFDSDLTAMNLPTGAQAQAQVVESDLSQLATVLTNLGNSTNAQQYNSTLQKSNLQTLLTSLQNDTNSFLTALRSNIL